MKTSVLACNTIRDELLLAERKVNSGCEIIWLESNLHNYPDKLRTEMQKGLDSLVGCDRVLMAFCFCGNSVVGLKTHSFELILPRIDDCISLLLGSIEKRAELSKGRQCFFLTKGWLEHESNIWSEYEYTVKKYGEESAQFVINAMFGNYDTLSLIDTGAYDVDSIMNKAAQMSQKFGLQLNSLQGTTTLLEQLLSGPWDESKFIIIPQFTSIEVEDTFL
jgi:hypothetical protein